MRFALAGLLIATALLAAGNPLCAAMVWTIGIAFLHMLEEANGKLWSYFGDSAQFPLLKRLHPVVGFSLIVLPAFVLQSAASYMAFGTGTVQVFWLAVLIGARLGDGVFSHAIPFARGQQPLPDAAGQSGQLNPGLATGIIYLVDGLALTALFGASLLALPVRELVVYGFAAGAGFFALVLPSLELLGRVSRLRG